MMKPTAFSYTLVGDCYIPDVELPEDDDRPIGKWGGADAQDVLGGTQHAPAQSPGLIGQSPQLSGRPQRTGARPLSVHRPPDDGGRGRDRGPETAFPVGLDTVDEQHRQPRRGDHQERDD